MGFPGRNLRRPSPTPPDLAALNERLLAGCDKLLDGDHYREGVPVRGLLADDLSALLPLPGARFDCVRWERRRADREGRVEVDGTPCCAGPYWHGRWMLVGLRAAASRSWTSGAATRRPCRGRGRAAARRSAVPRR